MTDQSLFMPAGARLQLPSGVGAVFLRWEAKRTHPQSRNAEMERVAMVRLDYETQLTAFSERFVRLCQVQS